MFTIKVTVDQHRRDYQGVVSRPPLQRTLTGDNLDILIEGAKALADPVIRFGNIAGRFGTIESVEHAVYLSTGTDNTVWS